jgi:hypothetical protein
MFGGGYQAADYRWGFYNASKLNLDHVRMEYTVAGQPMYATAGDLSSLYGRPTKGGKTDSPGCYPIPQTGTMIWSVVPQGWNGQPLELNRQEVQIAANVPDVKKLSRGTIWFVFDGKQWTVATRTWAETEDRVNRGIKDPELPDIVAPASEKISE